ncbi:hypothetical protein AB0C98_16265 [Streptomyces sp. NPDC048558]|uniref:hypothetical protein n=1 Tax=Streptomyces sp. NPDC048558 TaxID=3155759 RepID=UPI0033E808CB
MSVDQLPARMREFVNYLDGLVARLDQGGGWCGVFWQRDPEGMQACLDGREVPPWDVVESLLHDLAGQYGPGGAGPETERARALHAGALTTYDARPGGRDALGDRLDVMLREQRYAAERQAELGRLLASAPDPRAADTIRLDLAWARDDHERATARCAELRARMADSDRRAARARGQAIRRGRPGEEGFFRADVGFEGEGSGGDRFGAEGSGGGGFEGEGAGGGGFGDARAGHARFGDEGFGGAGVEGGRSGGDGFGGGGPGSGAFGREGVGAGGLQEGGSGLDRYEGAGAFGPTAPGDDGFGDEGPGDNRFRLDGSGRGPSGGGDPRSDRSVTGGTVSDGFGGQGPAGIEHTQPSEADSSGASHTVPRQRAPQPGAGAAERGRVSTAPETRGGGRGDASARSAAEPMADAALPVEEQADASLRETARPDERPAPRKRRRGGARFAGIVEEEAAPSAVPPTDLPSLPAPPVTARRTPRGARFAGAAEEAPASPDVQPQAGPADAEERRAVAGVVETLVRLRAAGRSGEAHALLVEAAYWPAHRIPLLAAQMQRVGLGADWATLLWEAASLPAERLVAAADALTAAGRADDGEQILRQGVGRPANEIGQAVVGLAGSGRHREVRALLDAYVRVRTPEEAARSAAPDPKTLVPLLLAAAQGVSDECQWDLVHALRVAGFTA